MSKIKRQAAKHGKAIVPLLADKYPSNEEKIANNPELKEFLDYCDERENTH